MSKIKEGWGFILNSKSMHYLIGNRSLCGNYYVKHPEIEKKSPFGRICNLCEARLIKRQNKVSKKSTVLIITCVLIITITSLVSFILRF